jgi:hypothetical protein
MRELDDDRLREFVRDGLDAREPRSTTSCGPASARSRRAATAARWCSARGSFFALALISLRGRVKRG